jgi:hypothetical protein
MDLQPYVDTVRHELTIAAAAGGPDAAELAERLTAPLESAIRLAVLEALSEGAELITRELAPGSVEVRLRGRDPEFTVTPAPSEPEDAPLVPEIDDDGGTWRVTLRLPETLRTAVGSAARGAGLSVNAWMVRAIAGALGTGQARRRHDGPSDKSLRGWVR